MSACDRRPVPHNLGGHSGGETPLPIPNREVKPDSADGTRGAIPRESRTPPISFDRASARGSSSFRADRQRQAARSFSRQSGSSVPQAADALADRRVRDEERGEALLGERVRRVERLGRRARLERDELHRLLEAQQRVGEAVRRVAELGGEAVGLELALRREQQVHERRGDAGRARTGASAGAQPPRRDGSTIAAATMTAIVWTSTSRWRRCASSCATIPSSSAGDATPSSPTESASTGAAARAAARRERARIAVAEHVEPRLDDARPAARRSTVEWSAGASPGSSSRAPTMPITIRSAYQ